MPEFISESYRRLFDVRVLHHYWLDEGQGVYDSLNAADREKKLLAYDVRRFLSINPTPSTGKLLDGIQGRFKATSLGFIVAVPKGVELPATALFEFTVTVIDGRFCDYTSLTWRRNAVVELYYQPEDRIIRYKEGVFVFSNQTGTPKATSTPGQNILFLSSPTPGFVAGAKYPVESMVGSHQAISDEPAAAPPSAGWQALTTPAKQPVYMHQDDAPVLVPPVGLAGVPARGIELTPERPEDVFALIQISTLATGNQFGLLKMIAGQLEFSEPVFEIRMKNRSTIWKYYDKRKARSDNPDNSTFTEPSQLPLTFSGNASSQNPKKSPPSGLTTAVLDNSTPKKVIRLQSEVFI